MHFSAPSIAILALAAGVNAGAGGQHEPPVHGKGFKHHPSATSVHGATGIPGPTGVHSGTGISTGTHPIPTGAPNNGTHGGNGTVISSVVPCFSCQQGSTVIPVHVPTKTPSTSAGAGGASPSGGAGGASPSGGAGGAGGAVGGGPGSGSGSGSGAEAASPSSTGFNPSNPGSKITAPIVGAVMGSIVYGAVMLLA
jgi:hypothetical protein